MWPMLQAVLQSCFKGEYMPDSVTQRLFVRTSSTNVQARVPLI